MPNCSSSRCRPEVVRRNDQARHALLLRPPPEDPRRYGVGGRSPGSRVRFLLRLPGASSSGLSRKTRCLQLRGQPRLRDRPSPCSLLRPAGAVTDDAATIAGAGTAASLGGQAVVTEVQVGDGEPVYPLRRATSSPKGSAACRSAAGW